MLDILTGAIATHLDSFLGKWAIRMDWHARNPASLDADFRKATPQYMYNAAIEIGCTAPEWTKTIPLLTRLQGNNGSPIGLVAPAPRAKTRLVRIETMGAGESCRCLTPPPSVQPVNHC